MNDGNEQKKVKAFSFNKFHPDFDEFPIPEIDLSFNMGSGKKSKESEINLSFRMGVGKKANEPELSRANSISANRNTEATKARKCFSCCRIK